MLLVISQTLKKGGTILSISRIREILKNTKYSDKELLQIREELYAFGEMTIQLFKNSKQQEESEALLERR
jgi:hypothetical protein